MANNDGNRRPRWPGLGGSGGSGAPGAGPRSNARMRNILIWAGIGVVLLLILRGQYQTHPQSVGLNTFFAQVRDKEVTQVELFSDSIQWTNQQGEQLKATLPYNYDPTSLVKQLSDSGIPFDAHPPSALLATLL